MWILTIEFKHVIFTRYIDYLSCICLVLLLRSDSVLSLDQIEEEVLVSALEECMDNAGVNRCFVIFKRSDTHTAAKLEFESDIAARYGGCI